jgi:hypothetical protein
MTEWTMRRRRSTACPHQWAWRHLQRWGETIENNDDNESEEVKQLRDSAASSVIEAIKDGDDSNNND